jgi:hypothetical protein
MLSCDNDQYIGNVSIGTPPQNFIFLFDSGSNIMWVPIQGCQGTCGTPLFDPNHSSTYNSGSSTMSLTYGSGAAVSGNYGSDMIHFANTNINISSGILWVTED